MNANLLSLWNKKHSWDFTADIAEFWEGFAIHWVSFAILSIATAGVSGLRHGILFYSLAGLLGVAGFAWFLTFGLGFLAVSVRRAHDVGISGAWIFVPLVGLVIGFLPSKTEGNPFRASENQCPQGHQLFQGAIWCISCQEIGAEPRLSFTA